MAEEKTLNAIVTGARRGIGRAIVELFAQKGINIWACASKENEEFEQDMKQLSEEYHVWIKPVYFDLANEEETTNALKEVIKEKQPIDILVNNAGVPYGNLMQMTPLKNLREVMEINFIAQIHVMQLISRVMMRQKSGSIINMGSVGGIEAREGYLAYGSSKAALLWATRSVSKELAKYNIRVNAVAPGMIETDMTGAMSDAVKEKVVESIPFKEMGKPEDIAETVAFLAGDGARYITGQVLCVDGGMAI